MKAKEVAAKVAAVIDKLDYEQGSGQRGPDFDSVAEYLRLRRRLSKLYTRAMGFIHGGSEG